MFNHRVSMLLAAGLAGVLVATTAPLPAAYAAPVPAAHPDLAAAARTAPAPKTAPPLADPGGAVAVPAVMRPGATAAAQLAAPAPNPLTPCSVDTTSTAVPATGYSQCVAGYMTSTRWTRGYAAGGVVPCILDPRALIQGAAYTKDECQPGGVNAENTAQARVIAQLNAAGVYGDSSALGITANLQWETVIPGDVKIRRPDLVIYKRNDPTGVVGLVEMKVVGKGDPDTEVGQYVDLWPKGNQGDRPVDRYHFDTPIDDHFEVTLGRCKYDPSVTSAWEYHTYSDPVKDGVIWVKPTMRECPPRKEGDKDQEKADSYEGTIGVDADHNGIDDFWDYVNAHPYLWLLDTPLPRIVFFALRDGLKVFLGRDQIYALEEAVTEVPALSEDAAWAQIVAGLPDVEAAGAQIIAGSDLTGLGLGPIGEELALEAVADGGFIAVGAIPYVLLLGAAIYAGYWLYTHWHLFGDPHLATLDGLTYDMQTVGEFHAVEVPSLGLDVQARFAPYQGSTRVSSTDGVAFEFDGYAVELLPDGIAYIDGQAFPATQQMTDLGGGSVLVRQGDGFVAEFDRGQASLSFDGTRIGFNIATGIPTTGLLGNNDGKPGNDLALADGTPVASSSATVIDGTYADSWRITDADSEFTYDDDEDTSTYTDLTFPTSVVTLGDFAPADQDAARQTCVAHGVVAGPQLDQCVLDVAETGDATYATAAAAVTDFLQDASAHTVDGSGDVTETFDGAVGTNFRPNSTETIAGTTVAGPVFDGSGYSFSVPSLPNHAAATVAFDAYAIGSAPDQTLTVGVSDPTSTSVVAFTAAGASVTSGTATVAPLGTGQTAQGATYASYRVTMPVAQYSPEIRVALTPSGFRGVIGTSLAVDNVDVHVTAVAPQTFPAALPVIVSADTVDGVAAAGAGQLENAGSSDVYPFTVPAGSGRLDVNLTSCPGGTTPAWHIANASGAVVASGGCGSTSVGPVASGAYALTVGGPGATGAYTLTVQGPQVFAVTVPLAVTNGTVNGAAAPGAGNFETGASLDAYNVTVPSGGQQLAIYLQSCPAPAYYTRATWSLIDTATQATMRTGGCGYADLGVVAAGSYQLLLAPGGLAGTYAFDLTMPQTFAVTAPLAVTGNTVNGVATTGAGNLETTASQDVYTFTVPTGGQGLNLNASACPWSGGYVRLTWQLLDAATGAPVANGGCSDVSLGVVAAGSYRLVVSASGIAGMYVLDVEAPQTYTAALPLSIGTGTINGAAAPGAGVFETGASQDVYTFTVPAGGQLLYLDTGTCPNIGGYVHLTWKLLDGTGATVTNGGCGFYGLGIVAAGSYRLVVDAGGNAGAYALNVEAPQTFATSVPLVVSANVLNGVATPGAGNFETGASQDVYTFTVPAGGQVDSLNAGPCPNAGGYVRLTWKLTDSSGAPVANGGCNFDNLGSLAAGGYTLTVTSGGVPGGYTVGIVASQSFTGTLPLSVTPNAINATATPGAGNFETGASQDAYTLTVPAGGQVLYLDTPACPNSGGYVHLAWKLLDSTGAAVTNGGCGYYSLGAIAAGSYRLVLDAGGIAGTYALALEPAQAFTATLPLAISTNTVNGLAVPGAGNFETGASQDAYTLTVPAGGQALYLNTGVCPNLGGYVRLTWKLLNGAGVTVTSGGCGYYSVGTVAAGSYQLVVNAGGNAGAYALAMESPQTFAAAVPLSITANTVNGVATQGAGNFETGASQDVYTLTVPAGGLGLGLNVAACPNLGGYVRLSWKLLNGAGATVTSGGCGYYNLGTVAAGSYQLVVSAGGNPGGYTVNLEPPQTFAAAVPLSITANTVNGVATPGAGNFETGASQDVYTFTVPAGGQILYLDTPACPNIGGYVRLSWKLLNSAGATAASGGCGYYSLGTVAAGDYRLVVEAGGNAGSYAVALVEPQTFAATVPLVVTANTVNAVTTAGAGTFETAASQDVYPFTVPVGGLALGLNVAACPNVGGYVRIAWMLVNGAGATVASGGCGYYSLGTVAAGSYQLVVSAAGNAGTYTVNLEPAQTFPGLLPLAVSANTVDATPTPGAGDFETGASQDVYTFTVPAGGQTLSLAVGGCPSGGGYVRLGWKLVNGSGATVTTGGCSTYSLGTLATDVYQLVFTAGGVAGTYTVSLH